MTNNEQLEPAMYEIWFITALDYDLRSYLEDSIPETSTDKVRFREFQDYLQRRNVSFVQPLFADALLTPAEQTAHKDGETVTGTRRQLGRTLRLQPQPVGSDVVVGRIADRLAALPRIKALELLKRYQQDQPLLSRYYRLRLPWPEKTEQENDPITDLHRLPGVQGAFIAPVVRRDGAPLRPNDPLYRQVDYKQQVALKPIRPALRGQWNLQAINVQTAWRFTTGEGVKVAVVDTGVVSQPFETDRFVLQTHPDLEHTRLPGSDAEVLQVPGQPGKWDPHGTMVAGVIAAAANETGMVGIAPDAKILSLVDGGLTLPSAPKSRAPEGAEWLAGIVRAAVAGARVINCSWHLELPCCAKASVGMMTQLVKDAITAAAEAGATVVCSMGNQSHYSTPRPYTSWPAALSGEGDLVVIGVGGVIDGPDGLVHHIGANYGASMTVVAPAHEVPTTDFVGDSGANPGNFSDAESRLKGFADYAPFGGTSAAAAHVSGVVALMLQVNPKLTPRQVRTHLEKTAIPVGTLLTARASRDDLYGHGLVNAGGAAARVAGEVALARIVPHLPDFDDLDQRRMELLLDRFVSHTQLGQIFAGRLWQVSEELAAIFDASPDTAAEVLALFEALYPMLRALSGLRSPPLLIGQVRAIRTIRRIADEIRAEGPSPALAEALDDMLRAATGVLRKGGSLLEAVGADDALR